MIGVSKELPKPKVACYNICWGWFCHIQSMLPVEESNRISEKELNLILRELRILQTET